MILTREQVEQIIDHYELTLSKLCGSDGVDASDLLKHDAALRAQVNELEKKLQRMIDSFKPNGASYD